jgi:hypothetical protein
LRKLRRKKETNMLLRAFTAFHVTLSLIGIVTGFVVVYGMLTARRLDGWTSLFLWTTVATSVTGFMFPVQKFLPSHGVGILSLIVLALAIMARNRYRMSGGWRRTYVITSLIALYFNVFVLIVQLFEKVPALKELAPTQSEPPFQVAQLTALVLFIAVGVRATMKFRLEGTA